MTLDDIFEGARVPTWLRHFEDAPQKAISELLVGRADMGTLSAEEPFMLLLDWLSGIGAKDSGFVVEVDKALAAWVEGSWGNPALKEANQNSSLTSVAWRQAADIIAMREDLDKSAQCLRQRVIADPDFLNALHEGRARDPMANAWRAIARYQRDRELIKQWWHLCSLPPNEPWYRGVCGIYGLRGLPPEDSSKAGAVPEEVAAGLAKLAVAFWDYQKDGWLAKEFAEKEFLRIARMTMAAYPFPGKWKSFWIEAVERKEIRKLRDWIGKIADLPDDTIKKKSESHKNPTWRLTYPDPQWAERAKAIARRLNDDNLDAIREAKELLEEQKKYAEKCGDTQFITKTACNFASKVSKYRPGLSYQWAELARNFDPWNAYPWNISAKALLNLGNYEQSFLLSIQAIRRFPNDAVARTGLAEVLKAQGRLDETEGRLDEAQERLDKAQERFGEAEAVYRETIERFPNNAVARTGLAEVLKAQGRFGEAEAEYRETIERFPNDAFARNGFAEVLKAQGRLDEAEAVYRKTIERFPNDAVARNGLAEVLKAKGRLNEAEAVYRKTIERFPNDAFARTGLAEVLKAQERVDDAEVLKAQERVDDAEVLKAQERVDEAKEVLKAQGQVDDAEAEYQETIERFPDDAVARNGLAGVYKSPIQAEKDVPEFTSDRDAVSTPLSLPKPANITEKFEEEGESIDLSSQDIDILLADAYLLRRWQLNLNCSQDLPDTRTIQAKAGKLLQRLKLYVDKNARVASEVGLLNIAQKDLDQAVKLLETAAERFRGSVRVQYALAHARRLRARSTPPSKERIESEIIAPWRKLSRINPHCRPIGNLGEGRAWLSLNGAADNEKAIDAFGRLAKWISTRTELPPYNSTSGNNSSTDVWMAKKMQLYVFGEDKTISKAEDIPDINLIRKIIEKNRYQLDRIEEDGIERCAYTVPLEVPAYAVSVSC